MKIYYLILCLFFSGCSFISPLTPEEKEQYKDELQKQYEQQKQYRNFEYQQERRNNE